MSLYPNSTSPATPAQQNPSDFALLASAFLYQAGALFTGLLAPAFFQEVADAHGLHFGGRRGATFSPAVTLWAWLSQVLSGSRSCSAAVARVLVLGFALGWAPCSALTGGYCKARAKLPEEFVADLARRLGQALSRRAPCGWRWRGHAVRLVDGTVVLLQDTPENLAEYPQQRSQKRGTSLSCARLVLLLCLATGAVLAAALAAYRGKGTGEISLLAKLLGLLEQGDVLVGDRYYGSFGLLALLQRRGGHGVFRLPASRGRAFGRQGRRLGEDDYVETWTRPRPRPQWVAEGDWDALPEAIEVRVLRVAVRQQGFRCREVYVCTTLLDAASYPKKAVAELYLDRWQAELDIRAIKQTLGMKILSCKTPERVRAELWVHLLAYNLARCVQAEAAWRAGLQPRQLSLSGAVQQLDAARDRLSVPGGAPGLAEGVLAAVAARRVGQRPDRYEPREVKHRQRKYKELKKSRQQRRVELASAGGEGAAGSGPGSGSGGRVKGGGRDRPSGR